jgi:tRNA-specific 2-thiouridylase
MAFLEARGGAGPPGAIVDQDGTAIGQHGGTHRFTVGQRKGLPPAPDQNPRFVLRIDAASGRVVVGPRNALGRRRMRVTDTRWLRPPGDRAPHRCEVQIRHHSAAHAAEVSAIDDAADVAFDAPVEGIAPGQAAVFFTGDEVLGGGWID